MLRVVLLYLLLTVGAVMWSWDCCCESAETPEEGDEKKDGNLARPSGAGEIRIYGSTTLRALVWIYVQSGAPCLKQDIAGLAPARDSEIGPVRGGAYSKGSFNSRVRRSSDLQRQVPASTGSRPVG